MIIYDLKCSSNHGFEGWFADRGEFDLELKSGRLSCPVCGNGKIDVVPSGGHVGRGRGVTTVESPAKDPVPGSSTTSTIGATVTSGKDTPAAGTPDRVTLLKALAQVVERNFEDVGAKFSEEALKIHCGEAEGRNIRGSMTPEEEKRLLEEGVEFSRIPLPRFNG